MREAPSEGELISVVVPLYEGGRFVAETIRSVLLQTHAAVEVIVVDDGSADEGPAVVEDLARQDRRVRLVRKQHSGIARTRNTGLAALSPESRFVLFLDQDDILAPDMLAELVLRLRTRPDAVGAYALADFIDDEGGAFGGGWFAAAMRTRRIWRDGRFAALDAEDDVEWPELFLANHLYPPSAVLLRREAVATVGGLSVVYEVADDWDLMVRLLRLGPILAWDAVKVGYRRHGGNASSNRPRNVRETRTVWANTYYSRQNSAAELTALKASWRAHQRASSRRKLGEAGPLLRSRHPVQALTRAIDGIGHAVLLRPLRVWRAVDPRDS